MYLYSALYYFITALSSTASDVVLAGNIEDFRTIAKQFVPSNLADAIFKMAKDAISHDASRQLNEFPKFRDFGPVTYTATEFYKSPDTVRPEYKNNKESESTSPKKTTSKYELSLDDIVEKIKKRLQSELSMMAATADTKTTTEKSYDIPKVHVNNPTKPQSDVLENGQPSRYINSPSRYVKQTRNDMENKPQEEVGHERKSQQQPTNDSHITKQSKYMLTQAVHLALKDSYEDYVTPKKDEDYIEQETEVTKPENVNTKYYYTKKEPTDQVDKKILNIFSDETETITKAKENINYEDETTNYNKRRIKKPNTDIGQKHSKRDDEYFVENLPYKVADNIQQDIQPYREENDKQKHEKEYIGDDEQPTAKTSKAKSEGIPLNIDSNRQYTIPDVGKRNPGNRFKINERQTKNTVQPKTNAHRLSSSNDLVKIPEVNEKYNLGEQIQNENQYRIAENS